MYITYKDKNLAFRFKHITQSTETSPMGTECKVVDEENNEIAHVFSKVHPRDHFNKDKGRQVSFGKALQALSFVPKQDRIIFWESYSNWRTNEPRMTLSLTRK